MLQAFLVQRASSLIAAVLGGFGVFCVIYSFAAPHVAAQALILLGAALAVSYFSQRQYPVCLLRRSRDGFASAPTGADKQHHKRRDDAEKARQHKGLLIAAVRDPQQAAKIRR